MIVYQAFNSVAPEWVKFGNGDHKVPVSVSIVNDKIIESIEVVRVKTACAYDFLRTLARDPEEVESMISSHLADILASNPSSIIFLRVNLSNGALIGICPNNDALWAIDALNDSGLVDEDWSFESVVNDIDELVFDQLAYKEAMEERARGKFGSPFGGLVPGM